MDLTEGKTYIITMTETEANGKKIHKKKEMKLLKCYKHHAQFEDKRGIRRSFQYWELDKIIEREQPRQQAG